MSPNEAIKLAQNIATIRDKSTFNSYLRHLLALQAQTECTPLPFPDCPDSDDLTAL